VSSLTDVPLTCARDHGGGDHERTPFKNGKTSMVRDQAAERVEGSPLAGDGEDVRSGGG